ncbi:MAG: zinc ribbon domain-containing protein [Clostridiales bacterium]|nr:zinc ribbon domain-containing protein [Clostridiales bacterium]
MICKKCGQNVQDGVAFCPVCGENLAEAPAPAPAPEAQKTTGSAPTGWKKIVGKIGIGCALATVAFALIFLFTVGIKTTGLFGQEQNKGLFYYFEIVADTFKQLELAGQTGAGISIEKAIADMFNSLFGMIATLALIIVTIVFSIIALVKGIKAISKGVENNYLKFAGIAFAAFFVLSNLYAFFEASEATNGSQTIATGLNDAGVTGIVLSGIFLLASIGCKIAVDVKSYINVKSIMGIVGTGVKVVCVLIMVCLAAYTITETSGNTTANASAAVSLETVVKSFGSEVTQKQADAFGMLMIAFFVYIVFMIIMLSSVMNAVHDLSTMNTKISLRMPIATVVFALLYMIFSIVAANALQELVKFGNVTYSATCPIVVFVLSLVNLAGAIVRNVGAKKIA